jgi:hypothetical protein
MARLSTIIFLLESPAKVRVWCGAVRVRSGAVRHGLLCCGGAGHGLVWFDLAW